MPISFKHKLIFIHIPKNAGTAITNTLNMSDIGHHMPEYYIKKYPNEWKDYKKFAVVRNPWDRVVSNYEYAKLEKSYWHSNDGDRIFPKHKDYDLLKNLSFEKCIELLDINPSVLKHQGWESQNKYLKINDSYLDDIIYLKFEDLKNELESKLILNIDIPKINSSEHVEYKKYFKEEKYINLINKIYYEDIKKLNYKFTYD